MKQSRFGKPTWLRVDVDRTSKTSRIMLRLDTLNDEPWCDAWMRARGIAGRHEKRELGRKDEDPLVATGYGYLKLEGTDDDADDEVAQNISSLLSTM